MNNNPNKFDAIDWNLTSWTGSRQEQIRRWKALSFDEILEAQEGMAELAVLHGESDHSSLPQPHIAESAATYRTNEITDDRHEIVLHGCTPEPLMGYLKALGVFRILSEQADADCRAAWKGGTLVVKTNLSREVMISFFNDSYSPSPNFSPWNGDGGFLTESGSSFSTIDSIRKSSHERFKDLRDTISKIDEMIILQEFARSRLEAKGLEKKKKSKTATDDELSRLKVVSSRVKELKEIIVYQIRTEFPDASLGWFDTCMQVGEDGFSVAPALGSGGVDGRMEFSANFFANFILVFENPSSRGWLENALFAEGNATLHSSAMGQFSPGNIGGPNATQGFEGSSIINPWDYILLMEGATLLAGAVSRRCRNAQFGKAAFPFTVVPTAYDGDSVESKDSNTARGELWLPLWKKSLKLPELQQLFGEGRAEWSGNQSRTNVDFAKAIANYGVDRGIQSFTRHGFLQRNGLAFLAAPLGRFDVEARKYTSLLHEADHWIERFRRGCGDKAPARFNTALRHIDSAVFDYCRFGGTERFQSILIALGQAEQLLTTGIKFRKDTGLHPMRNLSPDWIVAANDGSPEFDIALALADIEEVRGKLPGIRSHMEPVMFGSKGLDWADNSKTFVWNKGCLLRNLIATLERRLLDSERLNLPHLPLSSNFPASLSALNGFIHTQLDDAKIEQLLWGLILCRQATGGHERKDPSRTTSIPIPRFFPLLKAALCGGQRIYSHSIQSGDSHEIMSKLQTVKPDTRILSLLRANRVEEAINLASSRLKNAGIQPAPVDWSSSVESNSELIQRITAALLIPIYPLTLCNLLNPVIVIHPVPLGSR